MNNPHRSQIRLCQSEAEISMRKQCYAKAEAALTRALALDPDNASVLIQRSKCYTLMGKTELAIEDAASAIEAHPDEVRGYFARAEALFFAGEFELALLDYYTCVEMRPEVDEHHHGVKKCTAAIRKAMCFSARDADYMQALLDCGAVVECNTIPGLMEEELTLRKERSSRGKGVRAERSAEAAERGPGGPGGPAASVTQVVAGGAQDPAQTQIGNPFAPAAGAAGEQGRSYRAKLLESVRAAPPLLLRLWEPEVAVAKERSDVEESTPGWNPRPQNAPPPRPAVPAPRPPRASAKGETGSRPASGARQRRVWADATAETPSSRVLQRDKSFLHGLRDIPAVSHLVDNGIDYLSQRQSYWGQQQLRAARRPSSASAAPSQGRARSAGARPQTASGGVGSLGNVGARRIMAQALRDPAPGSATAAATATSGDRKRPRSAGAPASTRRPTSAGAPRSRAGSRPRSTGPGRRAGPAATGPATEAVPSIPSGQTHATRRRSTRAEPAASVPRPLAMRDLIGARAVRETHTASSAPSAELLSYQEARNRARSAGVAVALPQPSAPPRREGAPRSRSRRAGSATSSRPHSATTVVRQSTRSLSPERIGETLALLRDALATYRNADALDLAEALCLAVPSEVLAPEDIEALRAGCEAWAAKSCVLGVMGRGEDSVRSAQRCVRLVGKLEDAEVGVIAGRRVGRGGTEGEGEEAPRLAWPNMAQLEPFVQGMPPERFAALRQLGKAYFAAHAVTPAIDVFKALASACSANSYAYSDILLCLARCYFEQRDYAHAASYAKNAARGYERVACLRAGLGASDAPGEGREDWAGQVSAAMPAAVPPEMLALQIFPEPTARESYCFMLCLRGRALLGCKEALEGTVVELSRTAPEDPAQRAVAVLEKALWHAERWGDTSAVSKATQLLEAVKRYE